MRRGVVLAGALLSAAAGPSSGTGSVRWTYIFDLKADTVNGMAPRKPFGEHHRESVCESATDAHGFAKVLEAGFGDGCHVHQFQMEEGRMSFTAICPPDADGLTFDFDADGTYDDSNIRLLIHARGADGDMQATLSGTAVGVRSGTCR